MKKVQKISVSANKKRRSQAMQKPTSKIEKLSPASLENILKYFSHNEQIFFTSISSRFQKAFSQLHSIDHSVFRNFIKFLLFYKKIEKVSSPFSPYLNILLNMNLINLSYEEIKTDSKTGKNPTSKMLKDSKLNALKYFLNYRQDITSNKKIYISLSSYNDYLLYEEIIPLVKNFKECKYYLHIAQTNLKNFINKEVTMVNLFKQIPYVKCVGKPSESLLGKIQSSIFDQDIECMHYTIVLKSEENIEKAEKYFKKYPNKLLCADTEEIVRKFSPLNKESLTVVSGSSPYPLSDLDSSVKLKKVKFSYAELEPNEYSSINLDNIEEISGIINYGEENCDELVDIINNNAANIKKISRIQFGEEMDNSEMMQSFMSKLKNKFNIEKITTWFYRFNKGKDYKFMLETFPNLRTIQEDYDASGLYDNRFEINGIFSCNGERSLNEEDLKALTQMLKNNIKIHKGITFTLACNVDMIHSLFKFLNEKQETEVLNAIDTVTNLVSDGKEMKPLEGIAKMNSFEVKGENENLINGLKNVQKILVIKIESESLLSTHFDFIQSKEPIAVVFDYDTITQDSIDKISSIESVKFLIVKSPSIRDSLKSSKQLIVNHFV